MPQYKLLPVTKERDCYWTLQLAATSAVSRWVESTRADQVNLTAALFRRTPRSCFILQNYGYTLQIVTTIPHFLCYLYTEFNINKPLNQFSSFLFTCKLNNPKSYYKRTTSKKENKSLTEWYTKQNTLYSNNNNKNNKNFIENQSH
jgi:hypothetical protein